MYILTKSTPLDMAYLTINKRPNIIKYIQDNIANNPIHNNSSIYWIGKNNNYKYIGYIKNKTVQIL